MTETLFGLVPSYGLVVVFAVVALACLAVPLPASALVLASGGFSAAGDFSLPTVFGVTFAAFVLGDQLAFGLSRMLGPRLLDWLETRSNPQAVLAQGQVMVDQQGVLAVLLSHTILSPSCPYVSYACGACGMQWLCLQSLRRSGPLSGRLPTLDWAMPLLVNCRRSRKYWDNCSSSRAHSWHFWPSG